MNKTLKGAGAALAAGVLLLGGAGSLAYWSDSGTVTGDSISSGSLALTDTAGSWTLNGSPVANTIEIVPGDELVYKGTSTIDAEGENLQAQFGVQGGTEGAGALATAVNTTIVQASIAGTPVGTITEANDGNVVDVSVAVDFPFGTTVDNTSQNQTLNLDDIVITLTQTDATPATP